MNSAFPITRTHNSFFLVVIITASKAEIEWVNYKEVYGLDWTLYVIYYDEINKLLFIHSSDKSSLYHELANAVLYRNATIIEKLDVFKSFYEMFQSGFIVFI